MHKRDWWHSFGSPMSQTLHNEPTIENFLSFTISQFYMLKRQFVLIIILCEFKWKLTWLDWFSTWDPWISTTESYLRPIKCLKLIGNSFPERSANLNSVFSRENNGSLCSWCRPYNVLHAFSLRRSRVNLMTFHIIDLIHDARHLCTRFKSNVKRYFLWV